MENFMTSRSRFPRIFKISDFYRVSWQNFPSFPGELLENRLKCDKQIPYLAKNGSTSYNKQYSGCKPILNDTLYRVIV